MTNNTNEPKTLGQLSDKELVNFAGNYLDERKSEASESTFRTLSACKAAANEEIERRAEKAGAESAEAWAEPIRRESFDGFEVIGVEVVTWDGGLYTFWF